MTLSLLLLLALSPAGAETRPAWLSGESPEYPKAAYILGIGEASSQERAGDKARAEIAKAFGVKLTARTEVSAKETADRAGSSYSETVEDDVRTSAARVLDGVEVVAYWRDEQGYHHALAVLDRARNLRILTDKLAELDRGFAADADALAKAEGKFARLRHGLALSRAAATRRRLNESYRVLNPEGKGVPAPASAPQALAAARKAVSTVSVSVTASGEEAQLVASSVAESLADRGLRAAESAGKPDVVVEIQSAAEALPPENLTWFWARGTLKVTLRQGAGGDVFKRFTVTGQEAARDPSTCVPAVLSALAGRAADGAYAALTSGPGLDD